MPTWNITHLRPCGQALGDLLPSSSLDRYCVVFRHSMNQSLAVAVDKGDVTAAVRSSLRFAREGDVMLKRYMAKPLAESQRC
jgi:hypothetical protein